jgi:hypothetical protein
MNNTNNSLICTLCGTRTPAHKVRRACDGFAYCLESIDRGMPPITEGAQGPSCAQREAEMLRKLGPECECCG